MMNLSSNVNRPAINPPQFGRIFEVNGEEQAKRLVERYRKLDHPVCAATMYYKKANANELFSRVMVFTGEDAFDASPTIEEYDYLKNSSEGKGLGKENIRRFIETLAPLPSYRSGIFRDVALIEPARPVGL